MLVHQIFKLLHAAPIEIQYGLPTVIPTEKLTSKSIVIYRMLSFVIILYD